MKMCIDELTRIAKEQCDSVARALEELAKDTKSLDDMRSYRKTSQGKLLGIVDTTISIYARELANDDDAYWKKVWDLRTYENETDGKLANTFSKWYNEYLNKL